MHCFRKFIVFLHFIENNSHLAEEPECWYSIKKVREGSISYKTIRHQNSKKHLKSTIRMPINSFMVTYSNLSTSEMGKHLRDWKDSLVKFPEVAAK